MKCRTHLVVVSLICLLLPAKAVRASSYLTDAQFMHRGAGAFIGQITDVQVQSSDEFRESGTVQVKVIDIIAGTISTPTITLSYTRALQPTDDQANWDNITPAYLSLSRVGIGKAVLIFFTEDNGTYFLAPAGNSVQNAAAGFLLGRITKENHEHSDRERDCRQVQVEIVEVIYGWVGGASTIALCVAPHFFAQGRFTERGEGGNGQPMAAGKDRSSSSADLDFPLELENQELFISFEGNKIGGVRVATGQLVAQLQQVDSQ